MSRNGYNVAVALDPLFEAQEAEVGYNTSFKFRLKYPQNFAVPTIDLSVPYSNCVVYVDIMRSANSAGVGFYYGMTHETLLYQFINGVGTYLGATTQYVFASGSVFTITNTIITGSPSRIVISFTQSTNPVITYMAGYGKCTIVPNAVLGGPVVSSINPGVVINDYIEQTSNRNIFQLWPFRQYFMQIEVPSAGTYIVSQTIPLDAINKENSTMILKVTTCLGQFDNHGGNSNVINYFAVQGGSVTVPPYSMLIRNSTVYYSDSPTPLTLAAVAVTGSASTPPAVYFTATITTLAVLARVATRVECVCAANDDLNYI